MTVAENIRKFRKERKMTQRQLGEKCGMYESQIRKYELGTANPKIDTIKKIADALNVSIDRLTGDSVSSIIESRLEELDESLETVAKEADVPLYWLQHLDTFTPGELGDYEIGYDWITRVADVLDIPSSTLRSALARQETPASDDLPQITAKVAFGDANTYTLQGIGEPEPLSIAEKDHISKYRDLDSHGKEMVDFTLQKEWERSTAEEKAKFQQNNIISMVEKPTPDYLMPNAAHERTGVRVKEEERLDDESMID